MIRPPRRAAAVFLAIALVVGPIPPDIARAGGFVEAGAVSEAGVSAAAGPSAASFSAPSAVPSLGLAAAPLSAPSLSVAVPLSAASFAPASGASAAPARGAVTASAVPAAAPALALPVSAASAPAAEPDAAPEKGPSADQSAASAPAATPSSGADWKPHGLLERVAYGLAWIAAYKVPASYGSSKSSFDGDSCGGSCSAAAPAPAPVEAASPRLAALARLGEAAGRRVKAYRVKRAVDHDNFGGPKPQPLSQWGQAREGAKAGLRLVGVAALLQAGSSLLAALPWPLFLSPERMQALGRVELLIKYGPKEIATALAHAPLTFLGLAVPFSTALEEVSYRFWDFGVDFAFLALARPLAAGIAKVLEQVPDGSGFRSKAQSVIRALGGLISYYAFPVAAALSALKFAEAHFAHWGFEPSLFAINFVSALILTRLAYKTRGVVAPIVAHLTFNFAMLAVGALMVTFHMPSVALAFAAVATISGVYSVLKARAAARGLSVFRGRRLGAKLFAVAALAVALLGGATNQYSASPVLVHGQNVAAAVAAKPDPTAPVVVPDGRAAAPVAAAADAAPTAPAETPADMVARVKPSVLKIIVMETPTSGAIGSGVIVTPEGLAVTNGHVVGDHQPGDVVQVELASGQKIPAKIVAVNHDRDLAFLQLPPRVAAAGSKESVAWPTSAFAASAPREGDEVYAMGHPLDLPFTVTRGIVSGRGMRGNMYVQYLQTDASINHGNSGGPLYNARGEVVGINTMIIGEDGSIGLGFSISAPTVQHALAQFKAVGNINTASLGVVVDLSNPVQPARGVRVEYVAPDSPADKAGLRDGDVIVGLGGSLLPTNGGAESARLIATILAQAQPGQKISVAVVRDGAKDAMTLTLDAKRTTAETSGAHDFAGQP